MDLKSFLKTLKLNENRISMFLGGLVLLVAVFSIYNNFKKTGSLLPSLSTNTDTENGTDANLKDGTHTVARGETLWSIAEKYYGDGKFYSDLAKANNIENAGSIEVDQKLTIPSLSRFDTQAASTEPEDPVAQSKVVSEPINTTVPSAISGDTYTVVKGDSLWKIAVRAYGDGYKWTQISRENNLKNPDLIYPGNVFTLPR